MAVQLNYVPADAEAVTPSDATFVNYVGLYVGGTGDVAVVTANGTTVTFKAMPVGFQISLQIRQVKATGTTATNIVGFKAVP